jgi:outer membrane protein OmpA-like peptidoglycan-associated protein
MRLQLLLGGFFVASGLIPGFTQSPDNKIYLTNPSFEDKPQHSKTPTGWVDCGFPGESEPDIQPNHQFAVTKAPQHGNTYVGLVVRDNETWERIGQKLSRPMDKEKCYEFSLHLARSEQYLSMSRVEEKLTNYATPTKLRIYGGYAVCDKQQLLAETNLIVNYRWLEFNFKFEPNANYTHLTFEAFYKTPNLFPYNGNILIDNCSALVPVDCKEEEEKPTPVVTKNTTKPKVDTTPKNNTQNTAKPSSPDVANVPPSKQDTKQVNTPPANNTGQEPKTGSTPKPTDNPDLDKLKASDVVKGQTIRIPNVVFAVNDTLLNNNSFPNLNKLYIFLKENPEINIEIGGHTNGLCDDAYCNSLSFRRAKAVANYLIKKGIDAERLQVKGYGKTQPISSKVNDPANQRVEIKILKT